MLHLNKRKTPPQSLIAKRALFFKDAKGKDLWDFYCNNKSTYDYRTSEVKKFLLDSSKNRCAICTRSIYDSNWLKSDSVNTFTIEHIVPKDKNPSLIYEWDNMIPCCKLCNGQRKDKEYKKNLYINPCVRNDCESLFGFAYDGSIYCNNEAHCKEVNHMIELYNLNGESRKNSIKSERKWYFKLLIDEKYQEMVELNKKFGLSDNIIIFKDMYMFNKGV